MMRHAPHAPVAGLSPAHPRARQVPHGGPSCVSVMRRARVAEGAELTWLRGLQAQIATPLGVQKVDTVTAAAATYENDGVTIKTPAVIGVTGNAASGGTFWVTPIGYGKSGGSVFDYNANA